MRAFFLMLIAVFPLSANAAEMEAMPENLTDLLAKIQPLPMNGLIFPADYDIQAWLYYDPDTDDCHANELIDGCKGEAIYVTLRDVEGYGGPLFGFKTPRGFSWRLAGVEAKATAEGSKCISFTLSEEVRTGEYPDSVVASSRETNVCVTPTGFATPK